MRTANSYSRRLFERFGFLFFIIITIAKMSTESHNTTRIDGMKQELHDFKNDSVINCLIYLIV